VETRYDIASVLGEGLYVIDASGEAIYVNPEAERLLGWSAQELLGKNIHELIHHKRRDGTSQPLHECPMFLVAKTGSRFVSRNETFLRKDGTAFPVSAISTPLRENGKIVASVTAFQDISALVKSEQEREKLIFLLQEALTAIKALHGIIPICSFCKKVRDDKGIWRRLESYINDHTDARLSHSLCDECLRREYPDYVDPVKGS